MSFLRRAAPIEKAIEAAQWGLSEHLYKSRCKGATWQQLADANEIHRSTARQYARTFEGAARRYGWVEDQAPRCNALRLECSVCGETFTATRADARHCSSACRQDAYRKRKLGAS